MASSSASSSGSGFHASLVTVATWLYAVGRQSSIWHLVESKSTVDTAHSSMKPHSRPIARIALLPLKHVGANANDVIDSAFAPFLDDGLNLKR